jgi:hypothetical protein
MKIIKIIKQWFAKLKILKRRIQLAKYLLTEAPFIKDGLGLPLDPKIKRTVAILRLSGFNTSMSCEGHQDYHNPNGKSDRKKWGRFDDDMICYPWVDIYHPSLLKETKKEWIKLQDFIQKYNDPRIFIEDHVCSFTLRTKCSSLEEGQQVMTDFTEWLLIHV